MKQNLRPHHSLVGSLLVWMANELNPFSKFCDWEKKNVAREVNDVIIGRYDGRIQKQIGKGGGNVNVFPKYYPLSDGCIYILDKYPFNS